MRNRHWQGQTCRRRHRRVRAPACPDEVLRQHEVYHDGASKASVSATATTSGSRRTYSLTFTNASEYRENLMSTNVGVDVSGTSVIGGGSVAYSATVQGLTPIYDDYCYVHFYIGPNPYSAETIHYGVTGTYTHD